MLLKFKNLALIFLVFFIFSCNNKSQTGKGLTKDEKQFVARFQNKLLIKTTNQTLDIKRVKVKSENDIVPITSPAVRPVVYNQLLSTKNMTVDHKKTLFISQLLPQILITKFYMQQEKEMLNIILRDKNITKLNFKDQKAFIEKQLLKHGAENSTDLLQKLTTHPTSIILAQAAIESNWGSSLAWEKANNPFHIQAANKEQPSVKTFGRDQEVVYLKKYEYLPAAIADYFRNINTHDRFKEFRSMRIKTDNPSALVPYLENYPVSDTGDYVKVLSNFIERNDLIQYDSYFLDPDYINQMTDDEIAEIVTNQTNRSKRIVPSDSERIENITERSVEIIYEGLEKPEDIKPIESKFIVPYVYTNVVDLKYLPLEEKKQKFFEMLLPSVMVAAFGINETKKKLQIIAQRLENGEAISRDDSLFLEKQLDDWKARDVDNLLNVKMVTRPNSIMLAQAALETGWGSSRFFVHANNTFGVWSFNSNESRIQARATRSGKPVYVRKYDNLSQSIIDYYKVIARGPYAEYREQRVESDDPYEMVDYLFRYSEIGQEYTQRLKTVMRKSNLEKYDEYRIDPKYINEEE